MSYVEVVLGAYSTRILRSWVLILAPDALYPLHRGVSLFPRREVVGPDARVTYGEMAGRVRWWADRLRDKGVSRGDIVAVADVNSVRFMGLAYAASLVGAVLLPINYRLPPMLIGDILGEAGPSLLLYSPLFRDLAK